MCGNRGKKAGKGGLDLRMLLRNAGDKVGVRVSLEQSTAIWKAVSAHIASRLVEGRGTQVPKFGRFTLADDGSPAFVFSPEFLRQAGAKSAVPTFTPAARVQTPVISPVAVGSAMSPATDKTYVTGVLDGGLRLIAGAVANSKPARILFPGLCEFVAQQSTSGMTVAIHYDGGLIDAVRAANAKAAVPTAPAGPRGGGARRPSRGGRAARGGATADPAFTRTLRAVMDDMTRLCKAFNFVDRRRTGFVTEIDLARAAHADGLRVISEEVAATVVEVADADGDGALNFQEFAAAFSRASKIDNAVVGRVRRAVQSGALQTQVGPRYELSLDQVVAAVATLVPKVDRVKLQAFLVPHAAPSRTTGADAIDVDKFADVSGGITEAVAADLQSASGAATGGAGGAGNGFAGTGGNAGGYGGHAAKEAAMREPERTVGGGRGFVSAGPKFTDTAFPAKKSSLCHDWSRCKEPKLWGSFQWKRATEWLGADLQVFYGGITPSDIEQGLLGDCYFLSALSVLAEHPRRITDPFQTDYANKSGRYVIRLFVNGVPTDITLDDLFPYFRGKAAFSKAKGPEIWVMLAEKAWAKIHGSYQNIIGGAPGDVLSAFTGAPSTVYKFKGKFATEESVIWRKMLEGESNRWIMTGSVPDNPTRDLQREVGLIEEHSYGILDVRVVNGGRDRILCLRNPWGRVEWTGSWSDNSSRWTPELKREVGFSNADDGTFWMSFEDFQRYFSQVTITEVYDDHSYAYTRLRNPKPGVLNCVHLEVTRRTSGAIQLHQPSIKTQRVKNARYAYGGLYFHIVAMEPTPRVVADSEALKDESVYARVDLEPGNYMVVCQASPPSAREIVLSAYMTEPVSLRNSTRKQAEIEATLAPIYRSEALARGEVMDFSRAAGCSGKVWGWNGGMCMVYQNDSRSGTLVEDLVMNLENGYIVGGRGLTMKLRVGPSQENVIVVRTHSVGSPWGYGYNRSFRME